MKVLVVGNHRSGKSASKLLKSLNFKVKVLSDDRTLTTAQIDRLLNGLSFIVISPAVPPTSKLIIKAKQLGIKVISELELGYINLKGKVIGITGTNGKTTTTKLVGHLLKNNNTFVGGNIGTPITSFCKNTNSKSITVCEVSSFMLTAINKFKPHIAVLLNITPDHINYHGNMKEYILAKTNIFKNQTKNDFAVINADDKLASSVKINKAKVYYFSTKKRVNGCFAKGGNIYFRDTTKAIAGFARSKKIANTSDIKLIGEHNLSNALCAITCAILSKVDVPIIIERLKTFKPIQHRLEFVTDVSGVSFINDSKATNTLSTICAIKSMQVPTTLILGGSDKGLSFDDIFATKSLVTNYVFMGETKNKLIKTAIKHNISNYLVADSFSSAIEKAHSITKKGGCVLFSPACASFDMFNGYEQRGKCFCGIVRGLKRSENNRIKDIKKT